MPAQKRPAPHPAEDLLASAADESSPPPTAQPPPPPPPADQEQEMDGEQPPPSDQAPEPSQQEEEDGPPPVSDGGEADNSPSSPSDDDNDEFIMVKLADIRKEVQCPICLGIIRKTRTVMECLHRFCRECIDKSMRLGNNECPACRTHCASRRSLRDDPNYDSLISALYPDIDKYEEEEFAFHEEEKTRNRKIQASIAETFRRQSEALGKRRSTAKATAAAFVRKSQGNFSRGRGRSGRDSALAVSDDDDDDDANGNDGGKDSSSAEERSPEVRLKRYRRWTGPRSSPARIGANADVGSEDNDDLDGPRENAVASPLRVGNREVLAWGKGGARSQTRHGNTSGSNGRNRGGRINKLVEHLRNLDEKEDDEYDVYLILLPLDEQSTPNLEQPYLCCPPTLSIGQLCKFVARHISVQDEDVEMFIRKPEGGAMLPTTSNPVEKAEDNPSEELQKLELQELLAGIPPSYSNNQGDLVLLYGVKSQS